MHIYAEESNFHKWSILIKAGHVTKALAVSKWSHTSLWNSDLNKEETRFCHLARTANLQVNYRHNGGVDSCRLCHDPLESQIHVLNMCKVNRQLYTLRHNAVLSFLKQYLQTHSSLHILCDQTSEDIDSPLRVDLQIKNHRNKKLWLIDIKVAYESGDNFKRCDERNKEKYGDYKSQIEKKLKGWFVSLDTFIVGSLGSWNEDNNRILRTLGMKSEHQREIAVQTIKRSIQWGNQIWREHQSPKDLLKS